MSRLVPPDGKPSARFALFAEAPASTEVARGKPLVGPSGQLLERWWRDVGLSRRDFYLDNVSQAQAPANKFAKLPKAERAEWIASVPDRIAALEGPDGGGPMVLIACGEWALRAILGRHGITKHRGSLYELVDRRGRRLKVAPVLHPAAIFRKPTWEARCRADWRRIAGEADSRELVLPARDHRIEPSLADVCDFEAQVAAAPLDTPIAIDIETPRTRATTWPSLQAECSVCGWHVEETGPHGATMVASWLRRVPAIRKTKKRDGVPVHWAHIITGAEQPCGPVLTDAITKGNKPRSILPKTVYGAARITCVGFAISKDWSLTIPTTLGYWRDEALVARAWAAIKRLCESRRPKLLQNGLFDWYYLKLDHGIDLVNYTLDTLAEHHCLHTAEDHSLAYLASRYTREPFYKDDAKGGGDLDADEDDGGEEPAEAWVEPEAEGDAADWRTRFWRYNGKDVCVTHEVHGVLSQQLADAKRTAHYERHYARFYRPLHEMMVGGIRIDDAARARRYEELGARLDASRAAIRDAAGVDLFGPAGGISVTKMRTFLYETLRLPRAYKRNDAGDMVLRTDAVTLRRHIVNYPAKLETVGPALLECVRMSKLRSFLAEGIVDPDGRFRCSFKFTTSACRLASAKNPKRTGDNLQNQDLEVRDLFLPEPGHLWMKWDLEQIESRLWALLTGDPELVRRALLPPWEFDEHCYNARYVLGRHITKADKLERTVMKTTNHGFQGGMGGKKLAEVLLKRGIVRSVTETNAYIDALARAYPARDATFKAIRMEMLREHRLVNDFDDVLEFDYQRLDDDAFRKGYRFKMQSNAARILNGNGLWPTWRYLRARGGEARLLAQVHDELDASAPAAEAWDLHCAVTQALTQPAQIAGVAFSPFVSVELGSSWATSEKWDRPPTREQFDAAVKRLGEAGGRREEVAA